MSLVFLFVARESRYGHCVLLNLRRRSMCHRQGKKGQYLRPWASYWKNKDTLLSQTLKVEEKKVSLVFWFVAQEPRYGHFIFWSLGSKVCDIVKLENANILAPGPLTKKLRTLSFLQLLKFEKAKYPYFFNSWPRGGDISNFSLDNGTYSSSSF